MTAGGAFFGPLLRPVACARSAAAAMLVTPIPLDDLESAPGDRDQRIWQTQEQRAQPAPFPTSRLGHVLSDANSHTVETIESAEIVLCPRHPEPRRVGEHWQGWRIAIADEQLVLTPDEAHDVCGELRG